MHDCITGLCPACGLNVRAMKNNSGARKLFRFWRFRLGLNSLYDCGAYARDAWTFAD